MAARRRAGVDWTNLARLDGTLRLLHRPGTAAGVSQRAPRARTVRPTTPAALVYEGTLPTQETDCRHARGPREGRRSSSPIDGRPCSIVGRVVGVARTPAVVRRAAAVRQAGARDAAARAGGRARRPARGHGRRRRRSADDPDGAAGRLRSARRGLRAGRDVQLDHFLQRGRCRCVHRPAARNRRSTCEPSAA